MATTSTAGNISGTIAQAIAAARDNPQLQKMIEDQIDTRKLAIKAAKTGGRVYNRRRVAKKVARKQAAVAGDRSVAGANAGDQTTGGATRKRGRVKGKIGFVLLALVAALVAALANPGTREQILDALFGAEEEFEYTSTTVTSSVNGNQ